MDGFVASHLGTIKTRAQSVELIVDFSSSFVERVSQGRIDAPQLFLQIVQLSIESFRRMLKGFSCLFAEIFVYDARHYLIRARKEIIQAKTVAIERAPRVLFDERQTRARQDRRHRTIQ